MCDKMLVKKRDLSGKNNPNYGKKHPGLNKGIKRPYNLGDNNPSNFSVCSRQPSSF